MPRVTHVFAFLTLAACSTDTFAGGDAGVDAGSALIACKGAPRACFASNEACCLLTGLPNDQCIARPSTAITDCPNAQGNVLMCDDESDCPSGSVCCATPQAIAFSSACVPQSACATGGRFLLCDRSAVSPLCPAGLTCQKISTVSSYNACQP